MFSANAFDRLGILSADEGMFRSSGVCVGFVPIAAAIFRTNANVSQCFGRTDGGSDETAAFRSLQ